MNNDPTDLHHAIIGKIVYLVQTACQNSGIKIIKTYLSVSFSSMSDFLIDILMQSVKGPLLLTGEAFLGSPLINTFSWTMLHDLTLREVSWIRRVTYRTSLNSTVAFIILLFI